MGATSKDWKTGLLKTGLPFEYATCNALSNRGHEIFGSYPYHRPDEDDKVREFSVDIRTYKCVDSTERLVTLSLLVECKYRQPNTSWIFSPFPSFTIPTGLIHSTEDVMPVRLPGKSLGNFEIGIGYGISGVELDANAAGKSDTLKHGIYQLRYAMPVFLKNAYAGALDYNWAEGRHIALVCPILVTTAEIRVLRQGLNITDFTTATDLNDVTEVRPAIIVNERPGPQLQDFADSLGTDFINAYPDLPRRLADLDKVLVGPAWLTRFAPDVETIRRHFRSITERVLIVNFTSFDDQVAKLESALQDELKHEVVYGKIINTDTGYQIIQS